MSAILPPSEEAQAVYATAEKLNQRDLLTMQRVAASGYFAFQKRLNPNIADIKTNVDLTALTRTLESLYMKAFDSTRLSEIELTDPNGSGFSENVDAASILGFDEPIAMYDRYRASFHIYYPLTNTTVLLTSNQIDAEYDRDPDYFSKDLWGGEEPLREAVVQDDLHDYYIGRKAEEDLIDLNEFPDSKSVFVIFTNLQNGEKTNLNISANVADDNYALFLETRDASGSVLSEFSKAYSKE